MRFADWIRDRLGKKPVPPLAVTGGGGVAPLLGGGQGLNNEVIFSAVSRIATTLGCMRCRLMRDVYPAGGWAAEIVDAPNGNMTAFEFFRTLEVDRDTAGNGCALIIPPTPERRAQLLIQAPERVTPMINMDDGELWYQVSLTPTGEVVWVHNRDMLHVKHISVDGVWGVNPLRVLRDTLDYSQQISEFSLQHVKNGVNAGLILDFPAEMSDGKKSAAVNRFLEIYRSSSRSIIALDAGMRATILESSLVDTKLLDVDKITRSRVAAVYNLPPHMLGDYSASSYQSLEQQALEFETMTMEPVMAQYAQELGRKLLTSYQRASGLHYTFDRDSLRQADTATRGEYYFKMVRSAGLTPNEFRQSSGLPPRDGGDQLYISKDLVALKDLDKLTQPQSPAPSQVPREDGQITQGEP